MTQTACDLLIYGAGRLAALDPGVPELPAQEGLAALPELQGAAIAIQAGRIVAVGPERDLRAAWAPAQTLDAQGGLVTPAFVDAHTHPAFVLGRAEEFDWRAQGMGYVEIAKKGGGILSSVRAVRDASEEELTHCVAQHFRRMLRHGTATCEAKSGYGLSTESELKSLRAIRAAAAETGMQVQPTFLGAHIVPAEFRDNPDAYVDVLCNESLPAVAEAGLAHAADIYIESHAFNRARAERYLGRAQELGFALRVHAEQFDHCSGTQLAVELGAACADHLEAIDDADIAALAASGKTYAGLLPAVPHFLRQTADTPARRLIEANVPYFVATDFNPGTSYTPSIPEALHFARIRLRLTAHEALAGATCYAAASLGLGEHKGRIAAGYDADIVVHDLPDVQHLGYAFGENPVRHLVSAGRVVF